MQPATGSSSLSALGRDTAVLLSDLTQGASNWIQSFLDPKRSSHRTSSQRRPQSNETHRTSSRNSAPNCEAHLDYPQGFEPLRSECMADVRPTSSPVIRNPFVSPLLAPHSLLRGLPPVHIVVRRMRMKHSLNRDTEVYFRAWLFHHHAFRLDTMKQTKLPLYLHQEQIFN